MLCLSLANYLSKFWVRVGIFVVFNSQKDEFLLCLLPAWWRSGTGDQQEKVQQTYFLALILQNKIPHSCLVQRSRPTRQFVQAMQRGTEIMNTVNACLELDHKSNSPRPHWSPRSFPCFQERPCISWLSQSPCSTATPSQLRRQCAAAGRAGLPTESSLWTLPRELQDKWAVGPRQPEPHRVSFCHSVTLRRLRSRVFTFAFVERLRF